VKLFLVLHFEVMDILLNFIFSSFQERFTFFMRVLTRLPHAGKIRDWVNEKEERNVETKIFIFL